MGPEQSEDLAVSPSGVTTSVSFRDGCRDFLALPAGIGKDACLEFDTEALLGLDPIVGEVTKGGVRRGRGSGPQEACVQGGDYCVPGVDAGSPKGKDEVVQRESPLHMGLGGSEASDGDTRCSRRCDELQSLRDLAVYDLEVARIEGPVE